MDQSQQHPHGAEGAQGSTGKLQAEEQLWGSTSCAQAAHSRSGTQRAPNKPTPPGRGHSESPGSPVGLQGEARGSLSHWQTAQSHPKSAAEPQHSLRGIYRKKSCWDWRMQPLGCCWVSWRGFNWKPGDLFLEERQHMLLSTSHWLQPHVSHSWNPPGRPERWKWLCADVSGAAAPDRFIPMGKEKLDGKSACLKACAGIPAGQAGGPSSASQG